MDLSDDAQLVDAGALVRAVRSTMVPAVQRRMAIEGIDHAQARERIAATVPAARPGRPDCGSYEGLT
jgi:hypothetical protein